MYFDIIPIKKHIKLMVKTEYNQSENKVAITKVSPLLSQQNIFEATLVDDYLDKFFAKINLNEVYIKKFYDLKVPVVVNVYRKKQKSDIIILNPSMVMILKRFLDARRSVLKSDYSRNNFYEIEILKMLVIKFLYYNLNFSYLLLKKNLKFFGGLMNSLKFRKFMKSRKINFRRKIKRDSEGNIVNK